MRWVAASLVATAAAVAIACTAFDFPAPKDASTDAQPDAPATADGGYSTTQLLSLSDAAGFCAQLFRCPRLDEATELSMALPVATPLGFSACMDWVAGPIDPARPGLSLQEGLLHAIAVATSCSAAYEALPVRPDDAGACTTACPQTDGFQICAHDAGTFTLPCTPPYFGQTGACDVVYAVCLSGGMGGCTVGTTCTDPSTLAVCYASRGTYASYDCLLSGRQCGPLGVHLADCLSPGHNTAPCPLQNVQDACDGTSVLHCAGGLSAQTELDCAAVGRACSTSNAAGVARCVGTSDECTPFDADIDQCADGGSTISVCIGGSKQSFDCASLGLQCVPASPGTPGHCG